ncbi:MAG: DUF523 domain-containing protein [Candidatus Cloacimonetes bacterium]|nr:DUF523 domain-containing protein [Candidatus Cloacimonadota bacterium]
MKKNLLVSACLLGVNCRFDGKNEKNQDVIQLAKEYNLIQVCPEQLGGLPTPRAPSWFIIGDGIDTIKGLNNMRNEDGKDVSKNFRDGAKETLKICKLLNIKNAVLKEDSPSCGCNKIYLKDKLVDGVGVTTAILIKNEINVMSENGIRSLNKASIPN